MYLIYSVGNLKGYSINYYLNLSEKLGVDEKNNQKHKKFMKSIYKKIIFIISAIALFSVIVRMCVGGIDLFQWKQGNT